MTTGTLFAHLKEAESWKPEAGADGAGTAVKKRPPVKPATRRSSGGLRKSEGVEKPEKEIAPVGPRPTTASDAIPAPRTSQTPRTPPTPSATMEETLWDGLRRGCSGNRLAKGRARPEKPAVVWERWTELLRRLGDRLASIPSRDRLALAIEQREALAEMALAKGDFRVALAAWDSRDKFLGLLDHDPVDESRAAQTLARLMELASRRE